MTKPDSYFLPFAKAAYHDYGLTTDFKNFQGNPMPEWDALPDKIKSAWIASVKSTFRILRVSFLPNGDYAVQATPEQIERDNKTRAEIPRDEKPVSFQ